MQTITGDIVELLQWLNRFSKDKFFIEKNLLNKFISRFRSFLLCFFINSVNSFSWRNKTIIKFRLNLILSLFNLCHYNSWNRHLKYNLLRTTSTINSNESFSNEGETLYFILQEVFLFLLVIAQFYNLLNFKNNAKFTSYHVTHADKTTHIEKNMPRKKKLFLSFIQVFSFFLSAAKNEWILTLVSFVEASVKFFS